MSLFARADLTYAVYYDSYGIEYHQPLSDITHAGTLIDDEGNDMDISHVVVVDDAPMSSSAVRRAHRFSGMMYATDKDGSHLVIGTKHIDEARAFINCIFDDDNALSGYEAINTLVPADNAPPTVHHDAPVTAGNVVAVRFTPASA